MLRALRAGESSTIALDEQNVVEFICSRIGKQASRVQSILAYVFFPGF
jgi:hypothetical protein